LNKSRLAAVLFIMIVLAGAGMMAGKRQVEADTLWHLKAGQWIWAYGEIPKKDMFSWTALGQPWHAHEWLWEAMVWKAYSWGGRYGPWGLTCLAVLLWGGSLFFLCRRGEWLGLVLASAALLASVSFWPARPHALAQGLWALWMALLTCVDRWPLGAALGVPFFLSAFWANIHGSAATAFAFPLVFFFFKRKGNFLWASLGAFLGTALNPWGFGIYPYALVASRHPLIIDHISEWASPNFHEIPLLLIFSGFLALMVISALLAQEKHKLDGIYPPLVLASGFFLLFLISVRHLPYFLFTSAWTAAQVLPEISLSPKVRSWLPPLAAFLVAAAALCRGIFSWPPTWVEEPRGKKFPEKAVEFMLCRGLTSKVFNDYWFGGYLIFKDIPVFVDGRADMYVLSGSGVLEDFFRFWGRLKEEKPDPLGVVEKYGVETVLIPPHTLAECPLERAGWEKIYQDEVAVVLVRGEEYGPGSGHTRLQ